MQHRSVAGVVAAIALGLGAAWSTRTSTPHRTSPDESGGLRRTGSAASPLAVRNGSHPSSIALVQDAQATEPTSTPLESDPRKPGYDAARLYNVRGDGARLLFEAEPRDEEWAARREAAIMEFAMAAFKEVDVNVQLEVECHTGTCRVRVHSRNSYLTRRSSFYPLACMARWVEPEWGNSVEKDPQVEDPFSDFYVVFDTDGRSETGFDAQRDTVCPKYRDGWFRNALKRKPK